jgi:hypothetical protein
MAKEQATMTATNSANRTVIHLGKDIFIKGLLFIIPPDY